MDTGQAISEQSVPVAMCTGLRYKVQLHNFTEMNDEPSNKANFSYTVSRSWLFVQLIIVTLSDITSSFKLVSGDWYI